MLCQNTDTIIKTGRKRCILLKYQCIAQNITGIFHIQSITYKMWSKKKKTQKSSRPEDIHFYKSQNQRLSCSSFRNCNKIALMWWDKGMSRRCSLLTSGLQDRLWHLTDSKFGSMSTTIDDVWNQKSTLHSRGMAVYFRIQLKYILRNISNLNKL